MSLAAGYGFLVLVMTAHHIAMAFGIAARVGLLLAGCGLALLPAQRGPALRVDQPSAGDRMQLAAAGVGEVLHVAWIERINGLAGVCYSRSDDAGASWQGFARRLDTPPPGLGHAGQLALAADGDTVQVVWVDDRLGSRDIFGNSSSDGGVTWLAQDRRLSTAPPGQHDAAAPAVAVLGDQVHVAWLRERDFAEAVFYNRSTDGGRTWQNASVWLSDNISAWPAGAPRVFAAAGGAVQVLWIADAYRLFQNRSLDGGVNWLPLARPLNDPSGFQGRLAAIQDGAWLGVGWIATTMGPPGQVEFTRSVDGGSSWLPTQLRLDTLPPLSAGFRGLGLARGGGGLVYAVWIDDRAGSFAPRFNRSVDDGASWLAADRPLPSMSGDGFSVDSAQLAADGAALFVVWSAADGVWFSRSLDRGDSWAAQPQRLDLGVHAAVSPVAPRLLATAGSDTTPVVASFWLDVSASAAGVYTNLVAGGQLYGAATSGHAGGVPRVVARDLLLAGRATAVQVAGGRPGAPAALLFGLGPASRLALPWLGGTLWVRPDVTLGMRLDAVGALDVALRVPADPSLLGFNLNLQTLVLDPAAPQGLAMSRALQLWIG